MPSHIWKITKSFGRTFGGTNLEQYKPLVKVWLAPSLGFLASPGKGLIDTGADISCIDKGVAAELKLAQVDEVPVNTPDGKGIKPKPIYEVAFRIDGLDDDLKLVRMVEADIMQSQALMVLIGTDILNSGSFHYDAKNGEFTLELP